MSRVPPNAKNADERERHREHDRDLADVDAAAAATPTATATNSIARMSSTTAAPRSCARARSQRAEVDQHGRGDADARRDQRRSEEQRRRRVLAARSPSAIAARERERRRRARRRRRPTADLAHLHSRVSRPTQNSMNTTPSSANTSSISLGRDETEHGRARRRNAGEDLADERRLAESPEQLVADLRREQDHEQSVRTPPCLRPRRRSEVPSTVLGHSRQPPRVAHRKPEITDTARSWNSADADQVPTCGKCHYSCGPLSFEDHLNAPRGLGALRDWPLHRRGRRRGLRRSLRVAVRAEGGRVADAGLTPKAAALRAPRAARWWSSWREGPSRGRSLTPDRISDALGGLIPPKRHAATLAADALHRALGSAAKAGRSPSPSARRTLVAMSGGVDSAAAAQLALDAGDDVLAVTLDCGPIPATAASSLLLAPGRAPARASSPPHGDPASHARHARALPRGGR